MRITGTRIKNSFWKNYGGPQTKARGHSIRAPGPSAAVSFVGSVGALTTID